MYRRISDVSLPVETKKTDGAVYIEFDALRLRREKPKLLNKVRFSCSGEVNINDDRETSLNANEGRLMTQLLN